MTDGQMPAPGEDGAQPLEGCRVADLAGTIGAYCTKLLADLGADVIKVEPPTGDPMRHDPPIVSQPGGMRQSAVFAAYHANKRGITLDASRTGALTALEALGAECDVVVISPTRRTPVAGFDREAACLEWASPDAIVASITPFGLTGPLRDLRMTPFLSFAMGGAMHWVGDQDGPPLAAPGNLAWDEAGIHAALGVVSALSGRSAVGGQLLDLAVHEVAATKDFLLEHFDVGKIGDWGRSVGVGIPPTGTWECQDGQFVISVHQQHHWEAFLTMLDHPDELSEPSLVDPLVRREIFDGLQEIIARLLESRSRLDLFDRGQAVGLPCAPFNTPTEFVVDSQPITRQLFITEGQDSHHPVTIPWRWLHSSTPMVKYRGPAPSLGQHNTEIYVDELGFSPKQLDSWRSESLV
jgi:crotonobetainyl-CoA:carnitine CoA-transferase CaiB-like acyl-CoA transferase